MRDHEPPTTFPTGSAWEHVEHWRQRALRAEAEVARMRGEMRRQVAGLRELLRRAEEESR